MQEACCLPYELFMPVMKDPSDGCIVLWHFSVHAPVAAVLFLL